MNNKEQIEKIVFEALGEVSVLFMSNEEKGTKQTMPSEDIKRIGDNLVEIIMDRPRAVLPISDDYLKSQKIEL